MNRYWILVLSLPLLAGLIFSSVVGYFTDGFYISESISWQIQSRGQDWVDLFVIAPVLALSAFFAFRGSQNALSIWAGVNVYLTYTFLIYCFAVHFNGLFLVYCMNLGLAFYSLVYFLISTRLGGKVPGDTNVFRRILAVYFIAIAALFSGLWLSEILSSSGELSQAARLLELGLLTNPVHVIDLSVFLPGVFLAGILLWRNRVAGTILATVILTFFVLMDVTIGILNQMMSGIVPGTNPVLSMVMFFLALMSLGLLIFHLRETKSALV